MKQHIRQFFNFLEKKEDKRVPLKAKLLNSKHFKLSPEELVIRGTLNLLDLEVHYLPDNLTVEGHLYLAGAAPIKSLPDNLKVIGAVVVADTQIESLPDNLQVGGYLDLENTPLAKKYTKEQIRSMIEEKGGYVKKFIYK